MGLQKVEGNVVDFGGFEPIPSGDIIWQIQDGIKKEQNKNPNKEGKIGSSFILPVKAFMVINGEESEILDKSTVLRISAEPGTPEKQSFGERQMSALLTVTGLIDGFIQNGVDDFTTETFLTKFQVKAVGKMFGAHHDIDAKGFMKWTRFWTYDSSNPKFVPEKAGASPASSKAAPKAEAPKAAPKAGGSDW